MLTSKGEDLFHAPLLYIQVKYTNKIKSYETDPQLHSV